MKALIKWVLIIVIALTVVSVICAAISGDTGEVSTDTKQPVATEVKTQPEPKSEHLGSLSKMELLTNCQMKIAKSLKNPKSMDIEHSGIQYLEPPEKPNFEIWFQFYAQNSFGADVLNTAMCGFDDDGNIIESRFEQVS